jgi:hypothetical protein
LNCSVLHTGIWGSAGHQVFGVAWRGRHGARRFALIGGYLRCVSFVFYFVGGLWCAWCPKHGCSGICGGVHGRLCCVCRLCVSVPVSLVFCVRRGKVATRHLFVMDFHHFGKSPCVGCPAVFTFRLFLVWCAARSPQLASFWVLCCASWLAVPGWFPVEFFCLLFSSGRSCRRSDMGFTSALPVPRCGGRIGWLRFACVGAVFLAAWRGRHALGIFRRIGRFGKIAWRLARGDFVFFGVHFGGGTQIGYV